MYTTCKTPDETKGVLSSFRKDINDEDKYRVVDVRSDTISTPTAEMRKAMSEAVVGDDVYGEDPTVNELERRSAELLNKDASLFVPSGTMGNLLAVMVHCSRRGSEAITGDLSHIFLYEQGGAAQIGGVQLTTIPNNPDGTFCMKKLKRMVRGFDNHEPKTALVAIENTHNICGGKILPLEWIKDVASFCKDNSLALHMDGARLFNASEALQISAAEVVKYCDSVCFCLSKGLSAPVGSILVGSKEFISQARRLRKVLGGGMRQAGILAAAGLMSLQQIVPKLREDHRRAELIGRAVHNLKSPNVTVDIENVQTNILLLHITNPKIKSSNFAKRIRTVTENELTSGVVDQNGKGILVKASARDWAFMRIVTYNQITDEDVELIIKKLTYVIKEYDDTLK